MVHIFPVQSGRTPSPGLVAARPVTPSQPMYPVPALPLASQQQHSAPHMIMAPRQGRPMTARAPPQYLQKFSVDRPPQQQLQSQQPEPYQFHPRPHSLPPSSQPPLQPLPPQTSVGNSYKLANFGLMTGVGAAPRPPLSARNHPTQSSVPVNSFPPPPPPTYGLPVRSATPPIQLQPTWALSQPSVRSHSPGVIAWAPTPMPPVTESHVITHHALPFVSEISTTTTTTTTTDLSPVRAPPPPPPPQAMLAPQHIPLSRHTSPALQPQYLPPPPPPLVTAQPVLPVPQIVSSEVRMAPVSSNIRSVITTSSSPGLRVSHTESDADRVNRCFSLPSYTGLSPVHHRPPEPYYVLNHQTPTLPIATIHPQQLTFASSPPPPANGPYGMSPIPTQSSVPPDSARVGTTAISEIPDSDLRQKLLDAQARTEALKQDLLAAEAELRRLRSGDDTDIPQRPTPPSNGQSSPEKSVMFATQSSANTQPQLTVIPYRTEPSAPAILVASSSSNSTSSSSSSMFVSTLSSTNKTTIPPAPSSSSSYSTTTTSTPLVISYEDQLRQQIESAKRQHLLNLQTRPTSAYGRISPRTTIPTTSQPVPESINLSNDSSQTIPATDTQKKDLVGSSLSTGSQFEPSISAPLVPTSETAIIGAAPSSAILSWHQLQQKRMVAEAERRAQFDAERQRRRLFESEMVKPLVQDAGSGVAANGNTSTKHEQYQQQALRDGVLDLITSFSPTSTSTTATATGPPSSIGHGNQPPKRAASPSAPPVPSSLVSSTDPSEETRTAAASGLGLARLFKIQNEELVQRRALEKERDAWVSTTRQAAVGDLLKHQHQRQQDEERWLSEQEDLIQRNMAQLIQHMHRLEDKEKANWMAGLLHPQQASSSNGDNGDRVLAGTAGGREKHVQWVDGNEAKSSSGPSDIPAADTPATVWSRPLPAHWSTLDSESSPSVAAPHYSTTTLPEDGITTGRDSSVALPPPPPPTQQQQRPLFTQPTILTPRTTTTTTAAAGSTGPRLGAEIRMAEDRFGNKRSEVVIHSVLPNSPAEKAGLLPEDIIQKWDGTMLKSREIFERMVRSTKAGEVVILTIQRNRRQMTKRLTMGGSGGVAKDGQ